MLRIVLWRLKNILILNKTHDRTAKWDASNNCWNVADRPIYQWDTISPQYEELTDALNWIIDHDESKETNQKTV